MRTKTLLLTAALSAAGLVSATAQNPVYSVNIVGYINKTLGTGLSLIANQLNATPDNSIPTLFGQPTGSVTVSKFNPTTGSFDLAIWDPENGAWALPPAGMSLNPGQGAFVDNATGVPLPLTFVGEVQLNSTVTIRNGLDVYSSVIPQAGNLDAIQFPIPAGSVSLSKFNGSAFDTFSYDPENAAWSPSMPSVAIAEAFFVDNASHATMTWSRAFTVGP
jgi:hypothetical protein